MLGEIKILDPLKLNRGQLLHSDDGKTTLTNSDTIDYEKKKLYHDYVDKNYGISEVKSEVKNVVFLDWFEITIRLKNRIIATDENNIIEVSDGLILVCENWNTGMYEKRWKVIYHGEHFGTLQTDPKYSNSNHLNAQLKVENRMLYTSGWLDDLLEIRNLLDWKHIVSYTRIDIAIDGAAGGNAKTIVKKFLDPRTKTISQVGKPIISRGTNRNREIVRFHVGCMKSDKTATIYRKSDEIEKSEKQYIKDAWKRNNLENVKEVDRFELRLRSRKTKFLNLQLEKFDDPDYLSSIARTEMKGWFEFHYIGNDKNRYRRGNKSSEMKWIDWDSLEGYLLPKSKAIAKTGMHKAKQTIKNLTYYNYVEGHEMEFDIVDSLKDEYCLHKWYNDKFEHWQQEWNREKKLRDLTSN